MREFKAADGSAVYLKVIVFLLAANIAAGILAAAVQLAAGYDLLGDSLFNYAVMTVFQLGNAAVVLLHIRRKKTRPEIFFGRVRPETPFIGLLAGAVCLFGFYGLAAAFDALLTETGYVGQTGISFDGAGDIACGLIVTVAFAPVCEELVYRGALLSGLKKGCPAAAAVLLSGLAFSFMHMNPQQTVYQFCLGCGCAALALSSGSVVPAVAAHAVSNLLAVLMEVTPFGGAFSRFIAAISPNAGVTAVWTVGFAAVAAAAVAGLCLLLRRRAPAVSAAPAAEMPAEERAPSPDGLFGKNAAKALYACALGLTAVMWVVTLIQGYIA